MNDQAPPLNAIFPSLCLPTYVCVCVRVKVSVRRQPVSGSGFRRPAFYPHFRASHFSRREEGRRVGESKFEVDSRANGFEISPYILFFFLSVSRAHD